MIHLDVEKCCESCPNFVATSDTVETLFADGKPVTMIHMVYCANEENCEVLQKHIQEVADAITPEVIAKQVEDSLTKYITAAMGD